MASKAQGKRASKKQAQPPVTEGIARAAERAGITTPHKPHDLELTAECEIGLGTLADLVAQFFVAPNGYCPPRTGAELLENIILSVADDADLIAELVDHGARQTEEIARVAMRIGDRIRAGIELANRVQPAKVGS